MGDAGRPWPLFCCYRRSDSLQEAANLQQALDTIFGANTVFRDEHSIEHGADWPDTLRAALAGARALLVVIGPDWFVADTDPFNRSERRIDRSEDWVRREIERALARSIPVFPVLVRGAKMPPKEALPPSIEKLASLQAKTFDLNKWADGQEQLVTALAKDLHLPRHGAATTSTTAPRHDPLVPYRVHVRSRHQHLVTFPGPRTPLLSEVYVDVVVDPQRLGRHPKALAEGEGRLEAFGLQAPRTLRQLLEQTAVSVASASTNDEPISASGQPQWPRHWVLLGEPGSGKSTVLRHLCWQLASDDAPDAPIPVYVSLAAWATQSRAPWQLAEDDLRSTAGDEAAAGLASTLLSMVGRDAGAPVRPVWLLLDGLDEVAPERMPTVRDRIMSLLGSCPGAQIVVSSRSIGYQPFGPDLGQAHLRPLDGEQQDRLLTNWVGAEQAATIRRRVESRPALRPLLANPLQLTMVACLALEAPELPVNRTRLYQRALKHLLEKPWGRQNLTIEAPTEAMLVLEDLALALQRRDGVVWSKATLVALLKELGADVSPWRTRDAFLDQVAQRTGILAPFDADDAWRFQHRQLREVLAAQALLRKEQAGGSWEDEVGALHAKQIPRWSEVLGVFCALTTQPMRVLERLKAVDIGATVRALRAVEGVPPLQLLDFVWGLPDRIEPEPDAEERQHHWDGEDLRRLVVGWVAQGDVAEAELVGWLWRKTAPDLGLERLAYLWFALAALDAGDRAAWFRQAGRPLPVKDPIEWVLLPSGAFDMGSPETEPDRYSYEGPQRRVLVSAFRLAKTVISRDLYARFEGRSGKGEAGDHPAVCVGWWEARLCCAWLGARLPTEAEWEYACRAGGATPFSFGPSITTDQVNYDGSEPYAGGKIGWFRRSTVSVGTLPANVWGLHEMHGNVWEWCEDWFGDYGKAPSDGSAQQEYLGAGLRVLRGGSWIADARSCRSASRFGGYPGDRLAYVGFRPACSPP
jgi:sulfatase modifying factor 1